MDGIHPQDKHGDRRCRSEGFAEVVQRQVLARIRAGGGQKAVEASSEEVLRHAATDTKSKV